MRRVFDWRCVLLAVCINVGAVFLINLAEGGKSGATNSSLVQLGVSVTLAGFTIPFARRAAEISDTLRAYMRGSIGMAVFVASVGFVLHWVFQTPELLGTVLWNFGLNAVAGAVLISLKRGQEALPPLLRQFVERL